MIRIITAINPNGSLDAVLTAAESDVESYLSDGQSFVEGSHDATLKYADLTDPANPIIADKVPVPHTITGNVISGLPGDELQVRVSGPIADSFTIPAGETDLEFTADVPGSYVLTLSGVKHLPTEISIAV